MAKWTVPFDKLIAKAQSDLDTAARKATYDLFRSIIDLSPVGNPELWAANEQAGVGKSMRELYRQTAQAYNDANPGRRRVSLSRKALDRYLPLAAGKGYIGGRFRANWNVSYGVINRAVDESNWNPASSLAKAMTEIEKVNSLPVGGVIFLCNNLPYATRLENGWSSQAPSGMVRLSVVQWRRYVRNAVR